MTDPEALVDIAARLDRIADHHTNAGDDYTAKAISDLAAELRGLILTDPVAWPPQPRPHPGTVFTQGHGARKDKPDKGKNK